MVAEESDDFLFEETIFNGILLATSGENGPSLKLNASSLSDREAIATAVQGITAVGLGEEKTTGLFGPLPVPYNSDYKTLVYIFKVESRFSSDPEILENGLFCALFIVFRQMMIRLVANVYAMIESLMDIYQENNLQKEEDLKLTTLQMIYEDLVEKLKIKPRIRIFKIQKGITTEFEDNKILLGEEFIFIIDEREKNILYCFLGDISADEKEKDLKILHYVHKNEYQDNYKIKELKSESNLLKYFSENNITVLE